MKRRKKGLIIGVFLYCIACTQIVYAEGSLTTIVVNAEDDVSGQLMYAIDNTDSFTENNTFEVESGTTHTVYIKDEAGNITEQTVIVPEGSEGVTVAAKEDPEDNEDTDYSTAPDSGYEPVEDGGGTVAENTVTTGNSNDGAKQFLTVKTKNDHIFYIVIDNESRNDNVYLLDQVTDEDLIDLIAENDAQKAAEIAEKRVVEDSENDIKETEEMKNEPVKTNNKEKNTGMASRLLMLVLIGAGAGVYMYFKKKKGQKYDEDELEEDEDAPDLKKDFEAVEDGEMMEEDIFYGKAQETAEAEDGRESEEFEEAEDVAFDEDDDEDGVE